MFRCDVTIIQKLVSDREEVLQALPDHDALFLSGHIDVNSDFLDKAGKYWIIIIF